MHIVKILLGNSTSQGSSTSNISSSRISAYNGVILSLNSFIGASNLQGDAYSSTKSCASTVLIPLIQGAILLSEAVSNVVTTFPSRYTSEVAGENLDSEVLEAQIATYQAAYNRSSAWLISEMSKKVLNESGILRVQQSMARDLDKVTELQKKLGKLMTSNASSPSLFDEISGLYLAVSQGLSQVNNSFSSYNGIFSLPSQKELTWTTTITTAREEREVNSTSEEFDETIANIAEESGLTIEEVMAYVPYGKKPINYMKKAQKILATTIKYQEGKAFLKGKETTAEKMYAGISRESTRVRWNGKPLYDQETDQLFKFGKDLREASEIDISKTQYAWTAEGDINFSEVGKAGWSSSKSAIDSLSDFKGWKDASNVTKAGKVLGIIGTAMTVINNINADFINADGGISSAQNWGNFAVGTGVGLASGAEAAAIGAATGLLVAPPLGTVVSTGVSMLVSWGMNQDWGGGKSVTTWAKDSLKGLLN